MIRLLRLSTWQNQDDGSAPLSLWDDIFFVATGFFCLGVSLFGLVAQLVPSFVADAHLDLVPLVSYALIGAVALFFIVEGFLRIGRTLRRVNEHLKTTSVLH